MPIRTLRASLLTLGVALAAGTATAQTPGAPAADLPGGASALREAHGDWIVSCQTVVADKNGTDKSGADKSVAKKCVLSQEQVNPRNQRTLAINLVPQGDGSQGLLLHQRLSF